MAMNTSQRGSVALVALLEVPEIENAGQKPDGRTGGGGGGDGEGGARSGGRGGGTGGGGL